jgi:hypothetical protein
MTCQCGKFCGEMATEFIANDLSESQYDNPIYIGKEFCFITEINFTAE